jgi:SAM-dependent methyltransferase
MARGTAAAAGFPAFLVDCQRIGLDADLIRKVALISVQYYQSSKQARAEAPRQIRALEDHWYASLAAGAPDYGVYGDDLYVADCWACWVVYSRAYLRAITAPSSLFDRSVTDYLRNVSRIADLGCGIGRTTLALAALFPDAEVVGTNLDGISQTELARLAGAQVVSSPRDVGPVDLVFASEYFEHFEAPVDHLEDVLEACAPRYLIVANAFGAKSIGHFDAYRVRGCALDGRATSRAFGDTLRGRGYHRVVTRLWNNRPTVWEKAAQDG